MVEFLLYLNHSLQWFKFLKIFSATRQLCLLIKNVIDNCQWVLSLFLLMILLLSLSKRMNEMNTKKKSISICQWFSLLYYTTPITLSTLFYEWTISINPRFFNCYRKFWGYWTVNDFSSDNTSYSRQKYKGFLFAPMAYIFNYFWVERRIERAWLWRKKTICFELHREILQTLTRRLCLCYRSSDLMTN